jgi:hypothetical protein
MAKGMSSLNIFLSLPFIRFFWVAKCSFQSKSETYPEGNMTTGALHFILEWDLEQYISCFKSELIEVKYLHRCFNSNDNVKLKDHINGKCAGFLPID